MVAVGFNPRTGSRVRTSRRVATPECLQSSLRDERVMEYLRPWVETHGYHRWSLRDESQLLFNGTKPNRSTNKKSPRRKPILRRPVPPCIAFFTFGPLALPGLGHGPSEL